MYCFVSASTHVCAVGILPWKVIVMRAYYAVHWCLFPVHYWYYVKSNLIAVTRELFLIVLVTIVQWTKTSQITVLIQIKSVCCVLITQRNNARFWFTHKSWQVISANVWLLLHHTSLRVGAIFFRMPCRVAVIFYWAEPNWKSCDDTVTKRDAMRTRT